MSLASCGGLNVFLKNVFKSLSCVLNRVSYMSLFIIIFNCPLENLKSPVNCIFLHLFIILHVFYFFQEVFFVKLNLVWLRRVTFTLSLHKIFHPLLFFDPGSGFLERLEIQRASFFGPLTEGLPCRKHHVCITFQPFLLNFLLLLTCPLSAFAFLFSSAFFCL